MDAEGVPFEHLDGPEIMRRWPQWRLGDEHHGLFQADAGIADPNRGNAAHQRLAPRARRDAARPLPGDAAAADAGGGVEVDSPAARSTARRTVVIAADAWTNELLAPSTGGSR